MALNKTLVFNKYVDDIPTERERRISGIKKFDSRASFLWDECMGIIDEVQKTQLEQVYNYAKRIVYRHVGLSSKIYFAHPLRVASYTILFTEKSPIEAGIIGLLHNVLEVSNTSHADLKKRFGFQILNIIETLTVDRNFEWDSKYKKDYYSAIESLPVNARIVKIIDKFDNLFTLELNPDTQIKSRYLKEIKQYILPMVKRDLPFMYTYFKKLIIDS